MAVIGIRRGLAVGAGSAGGGISNLTRQTDELTGGNFTTTSTSFVDIGLSITLANRTGGKFFALCNLPCRCSIADQDVRSALNLDGVDIEGTWITSSWGANDTFTANLNASGDLDGTVLKARGSTESGTALYWGDGVTASCRLSVAEVS